MGGKAASSSSSNGKFSALVVDDNLFVRNLMKMILVVYGFKIEVAENGKEAVDLFKAGNTFDVVIMDLQMPIMDGIQATRELRAMGVKSLLVGNTIDEPSSSVETFIAAGLDDFFEKPLNSEKVLSILEKLKK